MCGGLYSYMRWSMLMGRETTTHFIQLVWTLWTWPFQRDERRAMVQSEHMSLRLSECRFELSFIRIEIVCDSGTFYIAKKAIFILFYKQRIIFFPFRTRTLQVPFLTHLISAPSTRPEKCLLQMRRGARVLDPHLYMAPLRIITLAINDMRRPGCGARHFRKSKRECTHHLTRDPFYNRICKQTNAITISIQFRGQAYTPRTCD